ncbi:restriction endonuclease subunit S [Pseudotamlana carrageenivorans]|uniref:Restriction endonuclease subunit S n=1 Tax=Pseudotamlana carrageenivorans TaxID=2069432 RepID=A0A2I7SJN3_9FLAO|nr:restriction endonuclease subunit S [Tamlana carrageenivorans]AUS06120.1 restriction endonuclease subunit S [Tamlana carrageenivorans]
MQFNSKEEFSFVEMKDLDSNNKSVTPSDFKKLKGGAKFQNGDTLFARITPCLQNGKICQVKGLKNNKGFGSTEFLVFRGKEGVSDSDFVYYLSRDSFVRQFAEANMIGTSGRQRVAKEAFQNLELELPPLQEQKAIASILSAIDDKIENNLAINKTLEDMAMALYKHWFVDFAPFQDGAFVDSELGQTPKGWEVKKLVDFCNLTMGQSPKSEFYNDKKIGFPFHQGVKDYGERFPEDITYSTEGNRYAEEGDILFSVRAPVGRLNIAKNKIILGRGLASLRLKNHSENGFLFYLLKNKFTADDIIGDGTVYKSVNKKEIEDLYFVLPDFKIIAEFNKLIASIDNQYLSNYTENQTLIQLRNTLLPKLISGDIQLKAIRQQVENAL